jgi:hypothetical protein
MNLSQGERYKSSYQRREDHHPSGIRPQWTIKDQLFWEELRTKLGNHPTPDVILRDFNIVKDTLDRLPPKQDNKHVTESLMCLKRSLDLRDGWRAKNLDSLACTFAQSCAQGGRQWQSRIDQIYVSKDILPFRKEWRISQNLNRLSASNRENFQH